MATEKKKGVIASFNILKLGSLREIGGAIWELKG